MLEFSEYEKQVKERLKALAAEDSDDPTTLAAREMLADIEDPDTQVPYIAIVHGYGYPVHVAVRSIILCADAWGEGREGWAIAQQAKLRSQYHKK